MKHESLGFTVVMEGTLTWQRYDGKQKANIKTPMALYNFSVNTKLAQYYVKNPQKNVQIGVALISVCLHKRYAYKDTQKYKRQNTDKKLYKQPTPQCRD